MRVRKAVIPAAGFGTRFLPATRSIPKPMIPVLDQPAIYFSVKEAVEAGIEHIVFVISPGQEAIGQHFGRIPALEQVLAKRDDDSLFKEMLAISDMADISFIYQREQLGLGHAVLTARPAIGNEPFAVFLPDDIIWSDSPTIGKMIEIFSEYGGSVVAVKAMPDEVVPSKGIVDPVPITDTISKVVGIIEKPSLEEAPSNLAILSRYVLTPEVFDAIENAPPGAIGEIQLTDGIVSLIGTQNVYAYQFPGEYFDVGNPLGLLKASVHAALQREGMSADFRVWLRSVI